MRNKRKFGYIELVFDFMYLFAAIIIGIVLLVNSNGSKIGVTSGIMALILVGGDSFHLVPRIKEIIKGKSEKTTKQKGFGKLVTSITMTVFYVILWNLGLMIFDLEVSKYLNVTVYIVATIRILLCLCPQNKWLSKNPPAKWGIYRNIPFLLLGAMVSILYFVNASTILEFKYMWIAIILSFLFYVPVVLWADKKPALGSLMLPKSCVYIWILFMFL